MRPIRFSLLVLSLNTLSACATLGTKSNLSAAVQPNTFQYVGLTITKQHSPDAQFNQRVDSLLVREFRMQLALIPEVRVAFLGDADALLSQPAGLQGASAIYSALVHVEITLSYNGALAHENGYNSWVRLQAFKLPEKQLLGDSYFNTQMGKVYTSKPTLEQSVHDGVVGALRPWLQKLTAAN